MTWMISKMSIINKLKHRRVNFQVDELFDLEDDLEIPGELLHLIDQLAARADLNGSGTAQAVGNNIAMLMADASPESPVRGLRIAAQGNDDVFSGDAFEIISGKI